MSRFQTIEFTIAIRDRIRHHERMRRHVRGPLTIRPDTRDGHFAILDENGDPVGAGHAFASSTVPGMVTLVVLDCDRKFGTVIRVPADWVSELGDVG